MAKKKMPKGKVASGKVSKTNDPKIKSTDDLVKLRKKKFGC